MLANKNVLIGVFILFSAFSALAQTAVNKRFFNQQVSRKGKTFVSWGYNRSGYSQSNIEFKGDDYHFTLQQVEADDAPESFSIREYFSPVSLTIPQYNASFGYYVSNHISLAFNVDHMKYVMTQDQNVQINGYINQPNNPYNGNYSRDNIKLTEDFLTFEHTDGLNYLNFEVAYTQEIYSNRHQNFSIEGISGLGAGLMIPKSNVKLFDYPRHDHFHLAGFGTSGRLGLNFLFFNKFFLQTNIKGGFIDMPNIVTRSGGIADRAKQSFFFLQENIIFGVILKLGKEL